MSLTKKKKKFCCKMFRVGINLFLNSYFLFYLEILMFDPNDGISVQTNTYFEDFDNIIISRLSKIVRKVSLPDRRVLRHIKHFLVEKPVFH